MRKKKFVFIGMLLFLLFGTINGFAQTDQLTNMSPEWLRTGARNGAVDSTDIVVYNPAGLTRMSSGLHLNLGNQTLFRNPEHEFDLGLPASSGKRSYEQDDPDYFIPNIYAAYNRENLSLFGGIYVPGNGVSLDYPNGSINTQFIGATTVMGSSGMFTAFQDDYLKASSVYLATEVGAVYAFDKSISFGLGIRYINAQNEIKAGATFIDVGGNQNDWKLRYDADADGVGAVLGMNISPSDALNIGLRYETRVVLNFETDLKRNDFPEELGLADYREKNRRDLPAMFGMGATYRISPRLTTAFDFNWYFQSDADWGDASTGEDLAHLAGDCWTLGGGLGYQVNDRFLFSIGTVYTDFVWNDINRYYESMGTFEVLYTDNWYIGTGFAWEFKDNVTLNFAIGQAIWDDKTIEYVLAADNGLPPVKVDTENATTVVAFGFDLCF